MIYSMGTIVAVQECTAQLVKDGIEKHLLTIYQKVMITDEEFEENPHFDPEWVVLAKSEIVYGEGMTMKKHFSQLKPIAREKMVKY